VDGHVGGGLGEAAVDAADLRLDLTAEFTVLAYLASAGNGDLDDGEAAAQLRPLLEQQLDRVQALEDPLGVVEPVDAEEDASGGELVAQRRERALHPRRPRVAGERIGVDRDRVGGGDDGAAVGQAKQPLVVGDVAAQAQAGTGEVVAVLLGLEGDHVGAQETVDQLLAPGEPGEQLRRRKRDMQEEADRAVAGVAPQQRRDEHQVVVVDPEQGVAPAPDMVERRRRESLVRAGVGIPPATLEERLLDQPVQERPERPVREAVVVAAQGRPVELERTQLHLQPLNPPRQPGHTTVPANPGSPARLERRAKRAHQAAGSRPPARPAPLDRQPIGNSD
jgi:hypothetical protein